MLALPGNVMLDRLAEMKLQGPGVPQAFRVHEVLSRANSYRGFMPWEASPGLDPYYECRGMPDVLAFMSSRTRPGFLIAANFGAWECPVSDGSVCVASDHPFGGIDPTSDNDALPPITTIWLATK
jgi:hypothetical protein